MGKTKESAVIQEEKPWYQSKTLIALIVAFAIQMINMFTDLNLDAEDLGQKVANLDWAAPLTAILNLLAIFGRIAATKKIKGFFGFLKRKNKD